MLVPAPVAKPERVLQPARENIVSSTPNRVYIRAPAARCYMTYRDTTRLDFSLVTSSWWRELAVSSRPCFPPDLSLGFDPPQWFQKSRTMISCYCRWYCMTMRSRPTSRGAHSLHLGWASPCIVSYRIARFRFFAAPHELTCAHLRTSGH